MKIIIYAICKNEAQFAARFMASCAGADGVYVLDTGSTDGTPELLRTLGATVQTAIIDPWRFDNARNASLAMLPKDADVFICLDLDEVLCPGWREALEAAWTPGTTRARYTYVWSHTPDGGDGVVFYADKIHGYGYHWEHPVHEVLAAAAPESCVTIPELRIEHWPDDSKSRGQYLPLLELSVAEDPDDDRNMHYLGREYYFYRRWEDAIRTLEHHLKMPNAVWADERSASMRYIARCQNALGRKDEARKWLWRAIGEAPRLREPYLDMAKICYEERDWDGLVHMCRAALRIAERPRTYICEAESWGSLPWDYLSIGLYRTGRYREALDAVQRAIELSPEDERLKTNERYIEAALSGK